MTKRSQGLRSGSRHKLSRSFRERGLSPITRSLQTFSDGDTVNVVIDPSFQKGQPHHRSVSYTHQTLPTNREV